MEYFYYGLRVAGLLDINDILQFLNMPLVKKIWNTLYDMSL